MILIAGGAVVKQPQGMAFCQGLVHNGSKGNLMVLKGKRIFVGTSGFSYPDWHGTFYPPDFSRMKMHELQFLAQFFDFCEINNSFYRPVNPETARKWCEYVVNNKEFQFTAKLTEVFTHAPGRGNKKSSSAETIRYAAQDIEDAKRGFDPIANAGKLGALLLQFPISFKYTEGNWDHLIDVLHLFREFSLAVEVRHKSWADPLVLKALQNEHVAFCNIDQTHLGETLEGTEYVTASFAYLRLHGRSKEWFAAKNRDARYDYLYSRESMQKVKTKIEKMAAAVGKTFVAANNHPRGQAAANAVELKSLLSGGKVSAPAALVKTYPVLEEFAVSENLAELPAPQEKAAPSRRRGKKGVANQNQQNLPL
jgi:uncharacterized protein YecE (DUF72 family)